MGGLWFLSWVESPARASCLLGFILLVRFGELYLWFQFWAWPMIAMWGHFCCPGEGGGGLLIVRVVSYGSLLAWGWAFPGCEAMGGLWALSKVESAVCTSTSPSYVYPACKLH